MQETSAVVIVAAGASRRMQGRDKLWLPLNGRIILARSVDVFQNSPLVDTIVIVTSAERVEDTKMLSQHEAWSKVASVVAGGTRRQDSVCIGLDTLAELGCPARWVMIHDAARPLVTHEILAAGLEAAIEHQAAIAAVPVKDTIKHVTDSVIDATPDRSSLWAVQTPQVFAFPLIHHAHHSALAQDNMTDDATLLERLGHPVVIFPGSYINMKITTVEDVIIAEALVRGQA
ncbi:MAG TPA: 2-C-methyl-D-erythritol 4-phosphate cytidylyltransferase [Ktedonobacteraceae bacterium]|nr:2-C-methyl-D-erythritol 4-phosphate cytidylyltransferase [Ktedonobacteraceae bacterium]